MGLHQKSFLILKFKDKNYYLIYNPILKNNNNKIIIIINYNHIIVELFWVCFFAGGGSGRGTPLIHYYVSILCAYIT